LEIVYILLIIKHSADASTENDKYFVFNITPYFFYQNNTCIL